MMKVISICLIFLALFTYSSGLAAKDLANGHTNLHGHHKVVKRAVDHGELLNIMLLYTDTLFYIAYCLKTLYIMAFTSVKQNGSSKSGPSIEILASGHVRHLRLYDTPGKAMTPHKGDLWKFEFSDFNFGFCPTLARIQRLYIVERTEDVWHIESIVTLVKAINGGTQILSQNLDINQWIVGGGKDASYRRLELTRA